MPFPDGLKNQYPYPMLQPARVYADASKLASVVAQAAGSSGVGLFGALPYLGPAMSLLGIGAQMYTNYKNRQLQEDINRQQVRLVREMNAYNSPVSQMARYKAAGLNPLAFMNNIDSGNQSAPAALGTPQYQAPDFGQFGDKLQNSMLYKLQEAQTESQIKLRSIQGLMYTAKTGSIEQQVQQSADTFGLRKDVLYQNYLNLAKDLQLKDANIEQFYSRAHLNRAQIFETFSRINNLYAQSELYRQQVNYYAALTGISKWQVKYMDAFYANSMGEIVAADRQLRFANAKRAKEAAEFAAIETYIADKSKDSRINFIGAEAENMQYQANRSYDVWQNGVALDWTNTILGGAAKLGSAAASIYGASKLGIAPAMMFNYGNTMQDPSMVGTMYDMY